MHEKPGQPEGPGCLLWLWSHAKLAALLAAALSGLAHSVSGRKLLNLVNTGTFARHQLPGTSQHEAAAVAISYP